MKSSSLCASVASRRMAAGASAVRTHPDEDGGWKLSEADHQKLVNLKARLLAAVGSAMPIRIAAPVLKLVVG